MRNLSAIAAAMLLIGGSISFAATSPNVFVDGGFEDLSKLKNQTSPDGVLPHKFSRQYDLGMWLGFWGPPSVEGGLGGFSTYDDPRDMAIDAAGNNNGYIDRGFEGVIADDIGNMNRSVDPTDPGNHVMEILMFWGPAFAQWVEAPPNQIPGHIRVQFDLHATDGYSAETWGSLHVYGMNGLPPNDGSFFDVGSSTFGPLNGDIPEGGEELFNYTYGEWMEGNGDAVTWPEVPLFDYLDVWHHVDTDTYQLMPDPTPGNEGQMTPGDPDTGIPDYSWWNTHLVNQSVDDTQLYDYYVVINYWQSYPPEDVYDFLWGRRVSEDRTVMDNISLTVETSVPGDFNNDGIANLLDINDFVKAIIHFNDGAGSYMDTYPYAHIPTIDPSQGAEAGDPYINLIDIPYFVSIVTGGAGEAAALPEPATLGLLAIGGLALLRRRGA